MEPEPGRELDRQMAREVLGIEPGDAVPPYSTNDVTAAALAERFSKERGWWHFERREIYGGWSVGWIAESQPLLVSIHPIRASAPTRALAICRSLLKVARSSRSPQVSEHPDLDRPAPQLSLSQHSRASR